jgi:hypothetical protein
MFEALPLGQATSSQRRKADQCPAPSTLAPTLSPAGVGTPEGREGYQLHEVIVAGH